MTEPYECWLHRELVPRFLAGYAREVGASVDVVDLLDRLLDTDVGRGRWLVLPVGGLPPVSSRLDWGDPHVLWSPGVSVRFAPPQLLPR